MTRESRGRSKSQLIEALIGEIRSAQAAVDEMDQAVADYLGVNRTDVRCLDIIQRAGRITAGRVAEQARLTTGAVTGVLDRLERAGYVRRARDADDRRRVLVELTPAAQRAGAELYSEQAGAGAGLGRYTVEQLELLLEFTRGDRELNERAAARVRSLRRRRER